jgi:uncharacterized protein (DUF1697 family)
VRYVVFLRALNVGNRRVKMDRLRSVFTSAGFGGVATHQAAGNVVFDASRPPDPAALEAVLDDHLGFENRVFLRSAGEIEDLLEAVPWKAPEERVAVSFLVREPDPAAARALEATASAPEALRVIGREVFFLREGRGIPTVHKEPITERLLDAATTRRGLGTIRGMAGKFLRS